MRHHPCRATSSLLVAMGIAACGGANGPESRGGWEAVRDTVGDTIVVRTVSGSVWGDAARLEPEVSIGMVDGPDEYLIGNPRSIAVGLEGEVYVLDRQVPVIRAYGADGTHLRDVGREGGGPGEYKSPGAIATLPDGRLLVRDPGNARISIFGPDGEYQGHVWYPGGFNTSRALYIDTAGYARSLVLLNYGTAPWDWIYGLVRVDPAAGIVDTAAAPTWDFEPSRITATGENGQSSSRVPFTARTFWTFSPLGYFVGGVSTDYRVDQYRVDEPVLRIEREWDPVPVAPEEAEEQRRQAEENMRRQYPGWRWNGPPVPDTKPPFRDVIVSWEGNIWVQLSTVGRATMTAAEAREEERRSGRPQVRFSEPVAYDVFTPDGRYLGHVRAPDTFQSSPQPVIRGDTVWAVARDALDVPTVVRYRVVHGEGEEAP